MNHSSSFQPSASSDRFTSSDAEQRDVHRVEVLGAVHDVVDEERQRELRRARQQHRARVSALG